VTSGRVNEVWQSYFDDSRKPYIRNRWPDQWLEIHPADAAKLGVESGDRVRIENDDVLVQTGGFIAVDANGHSYTRLEEEGLIRVGSGAFEAVAVVTDAVRPGVVWSNALWPGSPANSVVHRVPDPVTNRDRFELGKGWVRKIGVSAYKEDLRTMSFASRAVDLLRRQRLRCSRWQTSRCRAASPTARKSRGSATRRLPVCRQRQARPLGRGKPGEGLAE